MRQGKVDRSKGEKGEAKRERGRGGGKEGEARERKGD